MGHTAYYEPKYRPANCHDFVRDSPDLNPRISMSIFYFWGNVPIFTAGPGSKFSQYYIYNKISQKKKKILKTKTKNPLIPKLWFH